MRTLLLTALLACLIPTRALPVAVRFDPGPLLTVSASCVSGSLCPALVVPGATVTVCTYPSCAAPVITYTDQSATTQCPTSAPLTAPGVASCIATTGTQGQFGFWTSETLFMYQITGADGTVYGPYPVTSALLNVSPSPTFQGLTVTPGGVTSTNTGGYAYVASQGAGGGVYYTGSGNPYGGATTGHVILSVSSADGSCQLRSDTGLTCTGTQPVLTTSSPTFAGVTASTGGVASTNTGGYAFVASQTSGGGTYYTGAGNPYGGSTTGHVLFSVSSVDGSCLMRADTGLTCTGTQPLLVTSSPTFAKVTAQSHTVSPNNFAALPACSGLQGNIRVVTDSSVNTWGATVAGGGSNAVLAWCNGTAWKVFGK